MTLRVTHYVIQDGLSYFLLWNLSYIELVSKDNPKNKIFQILAPFKFALQ